MEEPLGKSQYDYLRRLAEMIGHLEDRYGQGAVKAIGVLGNDFYDKFLVLQALGQRFPDRLFFTTDLDARYLHPANIQWTRNLLVGSTFGLQLHPDLQCDIPPFRGCYQTSVFFATLRAFYTGVNTPNNPLRPEDVSLTLKPRIFEIGKSNAIDLRMADKDQKDAGFQPANQAEPWRSFPNLSWFRFLVIAAVLLLLCLLLWVSCTWDASNPHFFECVGKFFTSPITITLVIILCLTIVSVLLFNHHILDQPSEEPLYFTEGVSIWPTEIIRVIALALSWIFFGLSLVWLKGNERKIDNEFCFSDNCLKTSAANWTRAKTLENSIEINSILVGYFRDSHILKRLIWIIPLTVVI